MLAHPGGPYFQQKDDGVWTIPKGEAADREDLLNRAKIEFEEEVGMSPSGDWIEIGSITQKGGKVVHAWAFEADLPGDFAHRSNTFEMEWPRHSGKLQKFPEIDRIAFFPVEEGRRKMKAAQTPFLDWLIDILKSRQR